jgi:hypothetical protein
MLELLTIANCPLDDLIHTMRRATIEAILLMSAVEVARPKQQGKKTDRDFAYHGKQYVCHAQGTTISSLKAKFTIPHPEEVGSEK